MLKFVDVRLWSRMCITDCFEIPRNTEEIICIRNFARWKDLSVQCIVIRRYILWIKVALNLATWIPIRWQDQIRYIEVSFFYVLYFLFIVYVLLTRLNSKYFHTISKGFLNLVEASSLKNSKSLNRFRLKERRDPT